MENQLQKKIGWLEKRREELSETVNTLEDDRRLDRSTRTQKLIRDAKKEKLRLKDHIAWPKKVENPDLKSDASEVAVETITIVHEGLSLA